MKDHPLKSFVVLGTGSWGSALALHLDRQGHAVVLWGHDPKEVQTLKQDHANAHYLPGIPFPPSIHITDDLTAAVNHFSDPTLVIAVPSHVFEEMVVRLAPLITDNMQIMWATKGLSQDSQLLHEVCIKHLGNRPLAVLSGPSFAKEVAKGLPTAVTIASNHSFFGQQLVKAFHGQTFRVYVSDDLVGVQLGGVVKNVLAIAVGMSDGLGFGANAQAALITRGLAELTRLGEKLGAHFATMMGLSGIGDMILTCTDNQSRNRRFGLALGQGVPSAQAEKDIGQVVEGKLNVKQLIQLAAKHQVEMPICGQVYAVLFEDLSAPQAVDNLLRRIPKVEGNLSKT